MKIKIIGDRQPFVDGKKAMEGEEFDVSDASGKDMISSGLAIRADDTPKRARNSKGQLQKDDPATEANDDPIINVIEIVISTFIPNNEVIVLSCSHAL